MAITARNLTNRVLRALREPVIDAAETALTEEYQLLIWQFVNKARQEVEQAHKWRALRQEVTVVVPAHADHADIPGTNEHSLLMYDGCGRPMVFDITDPKNVYQMQEIQLSRLRRWRMLDQGQEVDQPCWCNVDADEDNLILRIAPVPRVSRTYSVDVYIPQGELDPATDLDTNIKVPVRPVELLALAYALEERGEELGVNGELAFQRAANALTEAIAQDYQAQATLNGPGQYDLRL